MISIDILQKITTLITCKSGRSTIGSATGFFFHYESKMYLITNRHVFINEKKKYYPDKISIRLNKKGSDLTQSDEIEYELYKDNLQPLWIEIKEDIDLAALEVSEDGTAHVFAALTPDHLADPERINLGLGEQVLVLGYPGGFYDNINNLPIVRSACIASTYGIPFQKKPIFLVDSILHPGTSGSPVITVPKTIYTNQEGETVISARPMFKLLGVNSGSFDKLQLNAIWYSSLITELLEKHKQQALPTLISK
jgi:hypothetical protein